MENQLAKIAVTPEADRGLGEALKRINENFMGGRVTKTELGSWLINEAVANLDEETINKIHQTHFSQVIYLEAMVKKLKAAGKETLGTEEVSAIQSMLQVQIGKKRQRKNTTESTSDSGEQNELQSA